MFWETIAALLLIIGTFPLWSPIAFIWGIIRAVLTFGLLVSLSISDATFDWSQLLLIPLEAFSQGFYAAWDIGSSVWNWGKFEHPVWAAIIGLFALGLFSR
jgi:hypothetical protein